MNELKKIGFKMGYIVLKTLGKGLYSNPWSAISELVANSLDAKAKEVNIIFNKKESSLYDVYIIDDGKGMSSIDLETYYAKIGHNKRKENPEYQDSQNVMGRKGIGKLAALYLTDNYEIITKKENDILLHYGVDFSNYKDEDEPIMSPVLNSQIDPITSEYIDQNSTFTVIFMKNVILRNYGDIAFSSLAIRLSNFFAFNMKVNESQDTRNVFRKPKMYLREYFMNDYVETHPLEKKIAFGNMLLINDINSNFDFSIKKDHEVRIGLKGKKTEIKQPIEVMRENSDLINGNIQNVNYALTGWMGMHSTINVDEARKNDRNYLKNNYYNPLQIRVYVRNKLAIENFQSYIKNTQTYGNYIEGELNFDIFDHNDMEDIATANRQDVDINDERVQRLIKIVETIVNGMISKRLEINKNIKDKIDKIENEEQDKAKTILKESISDDLSHLKNQEITNEDIIDIVTSKIKGEYIKNDFSLFFSHARQSRTFSDLIYENLRSLGANDNEIFYTSLGTQGFDENRQYNQLNMQIKKNIRDLNSMVVYFSYPSFKVSEYCMFEGGAGWATRSSEHLHIITDNHESIPKYLTINDPYTTTFIDVLNAKFYHQIINSINVMVDHLNKGRKIKSQELIRKIPIVDIPTPFELTQLGKNEEDYFDVTFMKIWNYFYNDIIHTTEKQKSVEAKIKNMHRSISEIK